MKTIFEYMTVLSLIFLVAAGIVTVVFGIVYATENDLKHWIALPLLGWLVSAVMAYFCGEKI